MKPGDMFNAARQAGKAAGGSVRRARPAIPDAIKRLQEARSRRAGVRRVLLKKYKKSMEPKPLTLKKKGASKHKKMMAAFAPLKNTTVRRSNRFGGLTASELRELGYGTGALQGGLKAGMKKAGARRFKRCKMSHKHGKDC